MTRFRWASVLLIGLSPLFLGWGKTPPVGGIVRSPLIAGLESYRNPEEIRSQLGPNTSWEILGESKRPPGDPGFPHHLVEVSVKDFSHLGFHGELRLMFLNDRLMTATFYPVEFKRYMDVLTETQKLRFKPVYYKFREAWIAPYTRIRVPTEDLLKEESGRPSVRPVVIWEDIRLAGEWEGWIAKHS